MKSYGPVQPVVRVACATRPAGGFTLVELMMTLAIAALLVTVAIPGFSNLIRNNRLIAGTNHLVTSLAIARSAAVKRGTTVSLCASNNATSCTGTPWNQGWLVFSDTGTAGSVDGDDTVIRAQGAVASDLSISVTGTASFRGTGFAVAECGSGCTDSPRGGFPLARSSVGRLLSALLPGSAAFAAAGNTSGSTTTSTTDTSTNTPTAAISKFRICDSRNGETGREIRLWASGRVDTVTVTCDGT